MHKWIKEWAENATENTFHPLDFCEMIEHEGLGPLAPIAHEAILAYYPARGFEARLHEAASRFLPWMKQISFPGIEPKGSSSWGAYRSGTIL